MAAVLARLRYTTRSNSALGDTTVPNMTAIPPGALGGADVFVRVWFNDGANGSQHLSPDIRLVPPTPSEGDSEGDESGAGTGAWETRVHVTAPPSRTRHGAVWTGSEMIVWGGLGGTSDLNDGGRYNPQTRSWALLSNANAPSARSELTAVWTGAQMIVWGGASNGSSTLSDGGLCTPGSVMFLYQKP